MARAAHRRLRPGRWAGPRPPASVPPPDRRRRLLRRRQPPGRTQDSFEAASGDLVFAPQGHFHYFENAHETDDLYVLIAFNADTTEPKDDISLIQSISALPPHVLAAGFGVDLGCFSRLPTRTHRMTIIGRGGRVPENGRSA